MASNVTKCHQRGVRDWPSADRPPVAAFDPKEKSTKNLSGQRMKLDYPIGSCSARALVGSIVALQHGLRPMDSYLGSPLLSARNFRTVPGLCATSSSATKSARSA
jgi:hypothetical protein